MPSNLVLQLSTTLTFSFLRSLVTEIGGSEKVTLNFSQSTLISSPKFRRYGIDTPLDPPELREIEFVTLW